MTNLWYVYTRTTDGLEVEFHFEHFPFAYNNMMDILSREGIFNLEEISLSTSTKMPFAKEMNND